MDRPRIGILADTDMRLYQFSRNSGLPRGYFDERRLSPDFLLTLATIVIGVASLVAFVRLA